MGHGVTRACKEISNTEPAETKPANPQKKKAIPRQRGPQRGKGTVKVCSKCSYVVVEQYLCPTCTKPDFRVLKCSVCDYPQTDTGTCSGNH